MGIGTSSLAFTLELILDVLEGIGAVDLVGFSDTGTAVWTFSIGAGVTVAGVGLSAAAIGGSIAGYLNSEYEVNEGKEPKVERIKESFENSTNHWDKKFHPFIQNQWVYSTYCKSSVVALPPVTWASNQFRIVTDDAGIVDTQMSRITPQNETHFGDPGTSIMVNPDESTDFWDNSFLRTEHPLKQILPIEDSEQINKRLKNNDEIQAPNVTEEVIPPTERLCKKLTDGENEMGDAVDGETDSKDREMFMDASRDFVLHLYLNDEEVEEYNVRRKQCLESENPVKCKKCLDEEFKRKVSERMKSRTTISDLTLQMYKTTISSLMHVINCFSKHAGLPDVQCKNDFK
ncbi:hypothetical protein HNY73_007509 [Argiope bruennichi]|uniref:Uncharacterized protein n=1 Tax=Argiope bruennichi TaxID=94029 RepID=A0A8T0FJ66_ARGBR|nr:hypothetical protein HNY73_007509 [Argiope bruennichi]